MPRLRRAREVVIVTGDLVVIDPVEGDEIFREQYGERRIPWAALLDVDETFAAIWQTNLNRFLAAHPRLDVVVLDAAATDELVIRWKWRR